MDANVWALLSASLALVLVSGCAPAPRPAPPPPPRSAPVVVMPAPKPPPPPPALGDWRDRPITPGDWRWAREGSLSVARYVAPTGSTLLSLSCDAAARKIALRAPVPGTAPAEPSAPLVITTTALQRVLAVHWEAANPAAVTVAIDATDPLLDSMAFSRGRLMVEAPGERPLYVPSWTEISRVIEDCR